MDNLCVICGEESFGTDSQDRPICEECAGISKERLEKMKLFFYSEYMKGWTWMPIGGGSGSTNIPNLGQTVAPNTLTGTFTPWVWKTNTGTYSSTSSNIATGTTYSMSSIN